jgi:glycosyltransferase involved in cell wall biosynthesis
MHILLIHQYYQEKDDAGGMRWNAMTKLWAEKGHQITVIAGMGHYAKGVRHERYGNKYTHTEQYDTNIRVIRTHVSNAYNTSFRGRMRAYFSFVWSGIFGGLTKARDKYDVIIVSSPPLSVGIIALVLSFLKRIPFILEVRDLWPESAIDTGVLTNTTLIKASYALEKRLYKQAIAINVVTPAMRDVLIRQKNIHPNKVLYIPNAADFDLSENLAGDASVAALRKQLGLEGYASFCYVGAHGVANHLEQILDTAERVRDEHIKFILIGDGMQKQALMENAQQRGLTHVVFIDSVVKQEALRYIMACDVGMSVLKKADTFKTVYSNKTFDYMACKKPILMAIDGVSRQLVEDADAGIFVEPENIDHFTQVVRQFASDSALRTRQGENGYQYVKLHFDRKVLADQYLMEITSRIKPRN